MAEIKRVFVLLIFVILTRCSVPTYSIDSPADGMVTNTPSIHVVVSSHLRNVFPQVKITVNNTGKNEIFPDKSCVGSGVTANVPLEIGVNRIELTGGDSIDVTYDPSYKTDDRDLIYEIVSYWDGSPHKQIAIIDVQSGKGIGSISPEITQDATSLLDVAPLSLYISADSKRIYYVTAIGVDVINTATNQVEATYHSDVPIGHGRQTYFDNSKGWLYFWPDEFFPDSSTLHVIDLTNGQINKLFTNSSYSDMTISPDGAKLYFVRNEKTCSWPEVVILNNSDYKELTSFSFHGWLAYGLNISPNGQWGIVSGEWSPGCLPDGGCEVTAFDAKKGSIIAVLPPVSCGKSSVFSPSGSSEDVFVGMTTNWLFRYNLTENRIKWYISSHGYQANDPSDYLIGDLPITFTQAVPGSFLMAVDTKDGFKLYGKAEHSSLVGCFDITEINPENGSYIRQLIGAAAHAEGAVYKSAY